VALWRERWREESEFLAAAEEQQVTDKKLMALIEQILSARLHRSNTVFYS
jgi:hypothetical protein